MLRVSETHNSPVYPKKLGHRGLWFKGGSVVVLMWAAGWVDISDGGETDRKTEIKG